jgi:mutator protein MutT
MKGRQKIRVLAAVVARNGKFLVCRRPFNKRYGGLWEFPGGKVEVGESDYDAIRRELDEELGLALQSTDRPLFEAEDVGSDFLIVFVPATATGEPQCREHIETLWADVNQIATLPLAPSDELFVSYLQQRF